MRFIYVAMRDNFVDIHVTHQCNYVGLLNQFASPLEYLGHMSA